jgi:hypothetical protein
MERIRQRAQSRSASLLISDVTAGLVTNDELDQQAACGRDLPILLLSLED